MSERDAKHASTLLDAAVSHPVLAAWFPELQTAVTIDDQGVRRLHASLKSGQAPIWQFKYLIGGRATDPIPGKELKKLLVELASKDGGFDIAVEILYMRLFSDKNQKRATDPDLIEAGRDLLKQLKFTKGKHKDDHHIGALIKSCLSGLDAERDATEMCVRFLAAVASRETYGFEFDHLLQSLFKAQPVAALNGFFAGSDADRKHACQVTLDVSYHHANPLDFVPAPTLLKWCYGKPNERYRLMARVVSMFAGKADQPAAPAMKWRDGATALLEKAPDKAEILKILVRRFRPRSWSGSRAAVMETRVPLFKALEGHPDPAIAAFARTEGERFRKEIELEKKHETEHDKETDERFE
jgi:hypothetical protein